MTTDKEWTWWVGRDEERYTTVAGSREEAVRIAQEEYEGAYIVEAMGPPQLRLRSFFDVDLAMERADEAAYDDHGDPEGGLPVFEVKPEQLKDLKEFVGAAIDAWQDKHELKFHGWAFQATRNHAYISADEDMAGWDGNGPCPKCQGDGCDLFSGCVHDE